MDIFIVRHGETEWNRMKLFYGLTDVHLNRRGAVQSLILKQKLQNFPIRKIYTSTLKRTKETAKIIFPDKKFIPKKELDEKSFGAWEGLNADQIEAHYPRAWQHWLDDPLGYTPPEAESFQRFKQRVLHEAPLLLSDPGAVLFVSHLGVIRLLLSEWFPEKSFWDIQLDQGNYTHLQYQKPQFEIKEWNQ